MSAYCLFDVREILDAEKMAQYRRAVLSTVERFDGCYVAAGGGCTVLEGDWHPVFPVILEFPSAEHARRWYNSPEYGRLKGLLQKAARFDAVLIEGF
jgi:Uncharacterized conserved protein